MSWQWTIYLLIVLIPIFLLVFFRKRVSASDQKYHLFVTVFAMFSLFYFIIYRWIPEWNEFIEYHDRSYGYARSVYYSKVLLLDLCPLMSVLLPVCLLFDLKRKWVKLLCPLTIIGSSITLFGQAIWAEPDNFFLYLFIGEDGNRLYFFMHLLSLILSVWILIICPNFTKLDIVWNFIFLVVWLTYMLIMVNVFKIENNATGLVAFDWYDSYGQYHKVYQLVPLPYPIIVIFWYTIAVHVNWVLFVAKNWLFPYKQIVVQPKEKPKNNLDVIK